MYNSVIINIEINCNVITALVWVKTLWTTVGGRISRHFLFYYSKVLGKKLEESMKNSGFDLEYIHTGPLIRREQIFSSYDIEERRKMLYKMLYFYNRCDVYHDTVIINRKETPNKILLTERLSKEITKLIKKHSTYFEQFDKVIVYYDNGQVELSGILNIALNDLFNEVEFRKAEPQKYRLLQVADFVCSMELLKLKRKEKRLIR